MSKETETMKHNAEVAQFRFALIAPVIQGLFPDASATAYYKRVSAAPLMLPEGTSVKYSYKTLENVNPANTPKKPWKNGNPCTAPEGLIH